MARIRSLRARHHLVPILVCWSVLLFVAWYLVYMKEVSTDRFAPLVYAFSAITVAAGVVVAALNLVRQVSLARVRLVISLLDQWHSEEMHRKRVAARGAIVQLAGAADQITLGALEQAQEGASQVPASVKGVSKINASAIFSVYRFFDKVASLDAQGALDEDLTRSLLNTALRRWRSLLIDRLIANKLSDYGLFKDELEGIEKMIKKYG